MKLLDPFAVGAAFVLIVLTAILGVRYVWRILKTYKNLPPNEYHIITNDGLRIALEREWFENQWVYVYRGTLPERYVLLEEKKEKLRKTMSRALREESP